VNPEMCPFLLRGQEDVILTVENDPSSINPFPLPIAGGVDWEGGDRKTSGSLPGSPCAGLERGKHYKQRCRQPVQGEDPEPSRDRRMPGRHPHSGARFPAFGALPYDPVPGTGTCPVERHGERTAEDKKRSEESERGRIHP